MINKEMLRPGDILLFRPKSVFHLSAWFITWAQNVIGKNPLQGQVKVGYCHVAIVDKDTDYLLEARWPKTHRVPINWKKLDEAYVIELWRIRQVNQEIIDKMMNWCYSNLGEWYDLGLFMWGMFDFKHMEVCSTFVAKACEAAGIILKLHKVINGDKQFWTPDEIAGNTDLLKRIV